jgi:hypothetical protein
VRTFLLQTSVLERLSGELSKLATQIGSICAP